MTPLGRMIRWARRTYFERLVGKLQKVVESEGDKEVTFDEGWLCWDGQRQVYAPILVERLERS